MRNYVWAPSTPPHEVEDSVDGIIKVVMPVFGAISSHMLSPQQREVRLLA